MCLGIPFFFWLANFPRQNTSISCNIGQWPVISKQVTSAKMAHKRRRVNPSSGAASGSSSASRPSVPSSSTARTAGSTSSPAVRGLTQQRGVSLRFSNSRSSNVSRPGSSVRGGEVFGPRATETDAEIQEREENDSVNEVMMAIDVKIGGTVGCAYYVAREETLFLMQDISSGDLDIVDTLKLHIQPTTIIISTRADENLEQHLSKEARAIEKGEDDSMTLGLPVFATVQY
jgi:DNA mismatch repair protein MSH5